MTGGSGKTVTMYGLWFYSTDQTRPPEIISLTNTEGGRFGCLREVLILISVKGWACNRLLRSVRMNISHWACRIASPLYTHRRRVYRGTLGKASAGFQRVAKLSWQLTQKYIAWYIAATSQKAVRYRYVKRSFGICLDHRRVRNEVSVNEMNCNRFDSQRTLHLVHWQGSQEPNLHDC